MRDLDPAGLWPVPGACRLPRGLPLDSLPRARARQYDHPEAAGRGRDRGDHGMDAMDKVADGDQLWRLTLQHSPVGMSLVTPEGCFVAVNQAFCRMLGYDAATLRALSFQDITHADDLDEDLALLQETLAGRADAPTGSPSATSTPTATSSGVTWRSRCCARTTGPRSTSSARSSTSPSSTSTAAGSPSPRPPSTISDVGPRRSTTAPTSGWCCWTPTAATRA